MVKKKSIFFPCCSGMPSLFLGCLHPTVETAVPVYVGNTDEIGVSDSFYLLAALRDF